MPPEAKAQRQVDTVSPARAVRVCLERCPLPDVLEPEWRALQVQAEPNFFNGWDWIGSWLRHLGPACHPLLLRAWEGADVVGLAVVVPQAARRLRYWPSRALHLHATGQREWDDITIEHNACLARQDIAAAVQAAMVSQLWALLPEVDQWSVPGVSRDHEAWRRAAPPVVRVREVQEAAYRVDLAAVRSARRTYLDTLGAQTRAAVRRSLRLYEGLGGVRLRAAENEGEALDFLGRLKHWHQAGWNARGAAGAFANPAFEAFHRRLIASAWPQGGLQLLRLTAGQQEVGYLYNFVAGTQVLAYQSGFHFGLLTRNHHPGLVTHALAVQQALEEGRQGYDFMAGDARYKQQLSNQPYTVSHFTLHRRSAGLWLEEAWRRHRARFTRARRAAT